MSYELGVAYISVLPSMKGFKKRMEGELGSILPAAGADQGKKAGKGILSGISGTLKKWSKRTLVGAAAAAGGFVGTALTTGFQRSIKIENAQATLSGLGYNDKDIKGIMDQALGAVKGTSFGLDEAVTVSSGALAAGVEDLEGYLKSVADVATITGRDIESTGAIFNKVMANNRLSGEEMNQLADSGIPVLKLIQDEYGVTADEARKMVSEGKVDAQAFLGLMEEYEGAALKSGDTTQGAFNNMRAAIARLGQAALEEVFPYFKTGFQGATKFVDEMTEKVKEHLPTVIEWLKKVGGQIKDKLQPAVEAISGFFTGTAVPAFQKFVDEFKNGEGAGGKVKEALKTLKSTLESVFNYITNTAIPAIKDIVMWFKDHKGVALAIVAAYGALRAAMIAHAAAQKIVAAGGMITMLKNWLLNTKLVMAAQKAWNAIIWLTHGAQKALNFVMKMNPVGLVIAVITALIGILVLAYKKHEGFRNLVNKVWASIKSAAGSVVNWFKNTAWPVMKTVFDKIGGAAKWLWNDMIKPYFTFGLNIWKKVFFWLRDTAWPIAKSIFNKVAGAAKGLYENGIKPAFNNIKSRISSVWDSVKGVFDKFRSGVGKVKNAFSKAGDGIKKAWEKIKDHVSRPITAVVGFVNKHFIGNFNKAFGKLGLKIRELDNVTPLSSARSGGGGGRGAVALASGGKVPGYSPHDRADNIPAWLTAGEYVLPVKATERLRAAVGDSGLEALRKGSLPGYADGGIVQGLWSRAKGAGRWVIDKAEGIFDNAKNIWKALVDRIIPDMPQGFFFDGAGKVLKSLATGVQAWVNKTIGGNSGPGGRVKGGRLINGQWINYPEHPFGWHSTGMAFNKIWAMVQKRAPEAILTSSLRPGAMTASGIRSLHGLGRAIDIVSGNMPATFNKIKGLLPWSQLYLTQMGNAQIGYRDAIVANTHRDHIHAAFADGGLVPRLYDNGGAIMPGLSLVANKTRQPEMVLTNDQWTDIREGNSGNTIVINGVDTDHAAEVADELLFAMRRARKGKYNRVR